MVPAKVTTRLTSLASAGGFYEDLFLVDTGAIDSMAPADQLDKIGVKRVGKMSYELADGTVKEYPFGLVQIEFLGETTAGRVIFGESGCEPLLGVTALESVGIVVDPANRTLRRLPALPLKTQEPARSFPGNREQPPPRRLAPAAGLPLEVDGHHPVRRGGHLVPVLADVALATAVVAWARLSPGAADFDDADVAAPPGEALGKSGPAGGHPRRIQGGADRLKRLAHELRGAGHASSSDSRSSP
jgi:clan AA aspartic protease